MFKTTAELTHEELSRSVRIWRKRIRERRQRMETRRAHAWRVAHQGAELLKREFGAQRVMVFGSLCHPDLFYERSDVDLVVWGMDERQYLRAVGRLLDLDSEFSVDLVEFDHACPPLRQVITQDGVEL